MAGSMMQNAAILWHVSLLVRTSQSRARARHGWPRARRADRHVLARRRSDRRRARPASPDAVHADGDGDVGRAAVVGRLCRRERASGRSTRSPPTGAAFGTFDNPARQALDADARASGRLAKRDQPQRNHVPDGGRRRPRSGRRADRGVRCSVGVRVQCGVVPLRHRRSARDARDLRTALDGSNRAVSLAAGLEGLRFVFSTPLIRSTMLLDFFATFFASATALLPIFAQDILHVGARGYGLLSSAPSVGAILASLVMVRVIDHIDRRGQRAAVGDWRVRPCDGRVRPLTRVPAVVPLPCADRRRRHRQHGDPQSGPATDDARFACVGE